MLSDKRNTKRPRLVAELNFEGHEIQVSKRFSESTSAGLGAGYLASGQIDKGSGIEVAIGCLFAPLRLAQVGASADEVEEAIKDSITTLEHYINLARFRCEGRASQKRSVIQLPQAKAKVQPVAVEDDDDDIDIENERFNHD